MFKKIQKANNKPVIGCVELCDLPDLGICGVEVRIDTGAKTSSLHVDNLISFEDEGSPWVMFDLHPNLHNVEEVLNCKAPVKDIKTIRSSNGMIEKRYVISTTLKLHDHIWTIDVTLSNRAKMTYLMLLGREGMANIFLVDPSRKFMKNK
ncbi:ATP-dependent zinc protease family protein [Endozoicomonas sp. 2B-B]